MSKKKKKKKSILHVILPVLFTIIIIAVILILAKIYVYDPFKEQAVSTLTEKLLQSEINADTTLPDGTTINAKEILDSMSADDKETVTDIIDSHISPSTIKEASTYLSNGDTEGLKNYAKDMLSDSETQKVMDLYEKYKDQITQAVQ